MVGDIRGAQGDPANLTLRDRLPAPAFDSGVAAADHRLLMLACDAGVLVWGWGIHKTVLHHM